ncbi:very short patch repair endonuclease [Curtobacterium sp. A7_M15]|uniref:very short patch repair endonuclease n=1 Tax=Curtobacterium sp. A7_M15 TaxID=3065241 RepID=UPI002738007A|nr:very short patch repair endonuclease [Curtobacterium sp. A7_M15]MDP4332127.1 very short patch repair endonuclease [Curtobacterium sp. A7_M15]
MEEWEADDARRRHMARFGRRDTAPELALRRELHRRGRRFFVDRQVSRQCRVRPDLVFPRARIAVFVDGCFWHYCEDHAHLPKANAELWRRKLLANRQRDAQNQAILVSEGWRVLRFWEHDRPTKAAALVEAELDRWAAIADTGRMAMDETGPRHLVTVTRAPSSSFTRQCVSMTEDAIPSSVQ